ncbi:MAG TPA: flavodoxin domain-containing protein [Steroidobacteraceae bacterium]
MLHNRNLAQGHEPRLLAIYGTAYGQTERIVHRIAGVLRARGWDIAAHKGDALPSDLMLGRYDVCLVAASIIAGKHQHYIREFVQRYAAALSDMSSAFVSVSGAAGDPRPERQEEAQKYVAEFLRATGWRPRLQATFGGAMAYTKYGFFLRLMTQWISRRNGGPTDTSRDHDFTDWAAVDRFAILVADTFGHVERRQAVLAVAGSV